jgi:hypothetical protein
MVGALIVTVVIAPIVVVVIAPVIVIVIVVVVIPPRWKRPPPPMRRRSRCRRCSRRMPVTFSASLWTPDLLPHCTCACFPLKSLDYSAE